MAGEEGDIGVAGVLLVHDGRNDRLPVPLRSGHLVDVVVSARAATLPQSLHALLAYI